MNKFPQTRTLIFRNFCLTIALSLTCVFNSQSQYISGSTTRPNTGAALFTRNSASGTNNGRVGIGFVVTNQIPVGMLHIGTAVFSTPNGMVPVYSALFEGQVAVGGTFTATPTSSDYLNTSGGLRLTGFEWAGGFANSSDIFSGGALRLYPNGGTYSWLQSYKTNTTYSPILLNALGGGVSIGKTSASAALDVLTNLTAGIKISDVVGNSEFNIGVAFCAGCYGNGTAIGDGVIRAFGSGTNRLFITNNGGSNVTTSERIVFATGYSGANDVICMRIMQSGLVGIGTGLTTTLINKVNTSTSGYGLVVSGGILTELAKVAVNGGNYWRDYVFKEDYPLKTLFEVENYISTNKHLSGIPTTEEVMREGLDLGKMDAKLLEKIEELTLYMIQLKKENEVLASRIDKALKGK